MNIERHRGRRLIHRLRALAGVTFLMLLAHVPAWSQSVREEESGRLSLAADNVSLSDLFRELSERGLVEAALMDPQIGELKVTVEANALTPGQAILTLLEAAGVAFTLQGAPGRPFSVRLGADAAEAAPVDKEPGSAPPRSETPERGSSPRPNQVPDPSLYEPAFRQNVTGDAAPGTGSASPDGRPGDGSVGWMAVLLGVGLLGGIRLFGIPRKPVSGYRSKTQ